MTDELTQLKKEVEKLKKQKKQKVALATTKEERDNLLREINQLEAIKKSPSALKKFGRTYLRGLRVIGRTLWKGIKSTSRNLDTNAPEFRQMSKSMAQRKPMQPFSPMTDMYMPKQDKTTKRMKAPKMKKKRKQVKRMKRTSYSKKSKKPQNKMAWDLP